MFIAIEAGPGSSIRPTGGSAGYWASGPSRTTASRVQPRRHQATPRGQARQPVANRDAPYMRDFPLLVFLVSVVALWLATWAGASIFRRRRVLDDHARA